MDLLFIVSTIISLELNVLWIDEAFFTILLLELS